MTTALCLIIQAVLIDDNGREPQLAVGNDGSVLAAYGRGNEVFCRRSSDGRAFDNIATVSSGGKLSLGMRRGPRIAKMGHFATITAVIGEKGGGADGDVVSFVSDDHGKSWRRTGSVNDAPGSAREGLHAMAVAPDGTIACAWLDLREKGTTLYLSSSKDHGVTWSKNVAAYRSPSGTICQCCHPSLVFDRSGRLLVMFRNVVEGNRDMYVTTTKDLATFSPAQKQGSGFWPLDACPMDGGMLGLIDGEPFAVWRRESSILTSSGSRETSLGSGKNPWMAIRGNKPYLVWQSGAKVVLSSPGHPEVDLASGASDPVIAASPNGKHVVAAWNQGQGIEATIIRP